MCSSAFGMEPFVRVARYAQAANSKAGQQFWITQAQASCSGIKKSLNWLSQYVLTRQS
jgi:hypothetical protein